MKNKKQRNEIKRFLSLTKPNLVATITGRKKETRRIPNKSNHSYQAGLVYYVQEPIIRIGGKAYFEIDKKPVINEDGKHVKWTWIGDKLSSRFMKTEFARNFVIIKSIKKEKLQDISLKSAKLECCETVEEYAKLWDSINKKPEHQWASNPEIIVFNYRLFKM